MLGVEHLLLGIDHLLFVLALVMLVKGWKRPVSTITAFTVAHSTTVGNIESDQSRDFQSF